VSLLIPSFGCVSLGRSLLPGVLGFLAAGVRAVPGLQDAGEALVADDAVVPGGLTQGAESRPDLRLVHTVLSHICGIVSNTVLDTVPPSCYHGSIVNKGGSMKYTCPTKPQTGIKNDILGCGHTFESEPDHEGFVDCPDCGIFFKAEQGRNEPVIAKCKGGCGRSKDVSDLARLSKSAGLGKKAPTWTCAECYRKEAK
jgi:hypothetical protein